MKSFLQGLIGWIVIIIGIGAFQAGYGFVVFLIAVGAIWWTMHGPRKPPRA